MRLMIDQSWKRAVMLALLIGVDLAVSLPIMGATYRPFSWMSIAPADASTLYPVIQNLTFESGKPHLSVEVLSGQEPMASEVTTGTVVLQRNTNLMNATGWTDIATVPAKGRVIHLIDTNPVTRAVFYRVKHILDGAP